MSIVSFFRKRSGGPPTRPIPEVADRVFAPIDVAALSQEESSALRAILDAGGGALAEHGFERAPFTKLVVRSERYAYLRVSPCVLLPGEAFVHDLEFALDPEQGTARWSGWKDGLHNDFDFSNQRGWDPFSESWNLFTRSPQADHLVNLVHRTLCEEGRIARQGPFPDGLAQLQQEWAITILGPNRAKPLRVSCTRHVDRYEYLQMTLDATTGRLLSSSSGFDEAPLE
jgi:hypothetical protein